MDITYIEKRSKNLLEEVLRLEKISKYCNPLECLNKM